MHLETLQMLDFYKNKAMANTQEKKRIVLRVGEDFTPSALVRHLNECFQSKSSGKEFSIRDVQQYTLRGFLPKAYGGNNIEVIQQDKIGIKLLRLR